MMQSITPRSTPLNNDAPEIFKLFPRVVPELHSLSRKVKRSQKYYAIEVLAGDLLDDEEFLYFAGEDHSFIAILASSLFPIWVNAIDANTEVLQPDLHYNNFPFPKISRKQREALEQALMFIYSARGGATGDTLSEIYWKNDLPERLLFAHEKLDDLVLDIFGIPKDASNAQIADFLMKRWKELASNHS